ncbi:hypothetical protein Tco_0481147 [Tanacetum coccineum]
MYESGSYRTHPEHVAFYEALEASMERANRDEFLAEKDKSRKRRRDDQDPPPPLPDSDLSKRKDMLLMRQAQHSLQLLNPQPGKLLILEKLLPAPPSRSLLLTLNNQLKMLKPVPEEDRPATPEPDWVIPLNDLPETENN